MNRGISFILISAFFFGTYGVWSRLMGASFGEFSQAWTRGLVLLILVFLANRRFKFFKPIQHQDLKWFILIGLVGGLNQAPYYFGFQHLSIGTATLLFYAALVVGGYLIGKLVFHEHLTPVKLISLGIALLGMYSLYHFSLSVSELLPATLTVLAGLLGATAVVLSKKLSGNYPEIQIMTGYFIATIIFNLPLSLFLHNPIPAIRLSQPWLAWFGYQIAYVTANLAVIEGFKHLEASVGSLIGLAEILFGIFFGVIFFSEIVTFGTILGTALIILSAALPNVIHDTPSH